MEEDAISRWQSRGMWAHPLPAETPKPQLTGEQPFTKKITGTSQKRDSTSRDKRHNKMVGGALLQIPYLLGGWTTSLETILPWKLSHRIKSFKPISAFPAWGSSPQRIWLRRPVGFDHSISTRWGETQSLLLEGTHKVSCTQRPRGKEQWPDKRQGQTYLLVLDGLLQRWGGEVVATMTHCKNKERHWQQRFWDVLTSMNPPRGCH